MAKDYTFRSKKEVSSLSKYRKGKTRGKNRSHMNYGALLKKMRLEKHEELRVSLDSLFHPTY